MAAKNESQLVGELNAAWIEYRRKFQGKEKGLETAFDSYMVALNAYTSFLKDARLKRNSP